MASVPLYDQATRHLRRNRATAAGTEAFLARRAFDDMLDRLGAVQRRFQHALLLGSLDAGWSAELKCVAAHVSVADPATSPATRAGGIAADESALPFENATFDLLVSAGTLDTADDLPGALVEARRILKPDSLLIGALPGAGSLPLLRAALAAADEASGRAAPRLHPGIDARTMGDLLARAGFVLTVVDVDRVAIGYGDLLPLVHDLRAHAATNVLSRRTRTPLSRTALGTAREAFMSQAQSGRVYERVELLHFLGWTPGPGQPQPAKRGSATASLAAALGGGIERPDKG